MKATMQVEQLITIIKGEKSRDELQENLALKDRENFRKFYLNEALNSGFIEITLPEKPKIKNQKHRLTAKDIALQQQLKKKNKCSKTTHN